MSQTLGELDAAVAALVDRVAYAEERLAKLESLVTRSEKVLDLLFTQAQATSREVGEVHALLLSLSSQVASLIRRQE